MAHISAAQAVQYAQQAGFSGQGLTNIVAIMTRESGLNGDGVDPAIMNYQGSGATGLTQILWSSWPNIIPMMQGLGYNVNNGAQVQAALQDPLTNLRVAYAASNGGQDFSDWNYPGQGPDSYLYDTNIPLAQQLTSGKVAGGQHFSGGVGDAVQVGNNGSGSGSPDYGGMAQQAQDVLQSIAQTKPDPSNFPKVTSTDGSVLDPGGAGSPSYQTALQTWQANYLDALKTVQSLQNATLGVAQLPDGSVVSTSDLTPDQASAINSSNLNNYSALLNKYGLDSYNLTTGYVSGNNSTASTDFNNKIAGLNAKMGIDSNNIQAASAELSRWMDAQNVAQTDATNIANAQKQIQQYGTTNGKTSFTGADLGGGVSALAAQANVAAGTPVLQYPGFQTLNPVQDRLNSLAAMGISNTPPPIPMPQTTYGDIPPTPGLSMLPPPPGLQAPSPPPLAYPGTTGAAASSGPPSAYSLLPPALQGLTIGGIPVFGNGG